MEVGKWKMAQTWRHFKRPASSKGMWKQFVEESKKRDQMAEGGTPQFVQPGPGRQGYSGEANIKTWEKNTGKKFTDLTNENIRRHIITGETTGVGRQDTPQAKFNPDRIYKKYNFSETEVNKASQHYTGKNWNQLEGKEYNKAREYVTNNLRRNEGKFIADKGLKYKTLKERYQSKGKYVAKAREDIKTAKKKAGPATTSQSEQVIENIKKLNDPYRTMSVDDIAKDKNLLKRLRLQFDPKTGDVNFNGYTKLDKKGKTIMTDLELASHAKKKALKNNLFTHDHISGRTLLKQNVGYPINLQPTTYMENSILNSMRKYLLNNPDAKIDSIDNYLKSQNLTIRGREFKQTHGFKEPIKYIPETGTSNIVDMASAKITKVKPTALPKAMRGTTGVTLGMGLGMADDLIKSPGAKKAIRGMGWLLGPLDVVLEGGMALPALARGNPQMARRSTTPGVFGSYGGTMLEDIKKYNRGAYRYTKAMKDVNEWNALEADIERAKKVISGEIGGYPGVAQRDLAEAKKKQALLEKNFSPTKDDDFQAFQDTMTQMAEDSREWSGDKNWLGQERGEQSTQESLEAAGVKPIDAHMMMQNADTTDEWRRKHQLEELDYELGGLDVETFLDPYRLKTQDPRYSDLPTDIASDYGNWEANQVRQKLEQLQNIDPGVAYAQGGIAGLLKK